MEGADKAAFDMKKLKDQLDEEKRQRQSAEKLAEDRKKQLAIAKEKASDVTN